MMKQREVGVKPWEEIALDHFEDKEAAIGVDPSLLPLGSMKAKKKYWSEQDSKVRWEEVTENLVDQLWED